MPFPPRVHSLHLWGQAKIFGLLGGVLGAARSVCSHAAESICLPWGLFCKANLECVSLVLLLDISSLDLNCLHVSSRIEWFVSNLFSRPFGPRFWIVFAVPIRITCPGCQSILDVKDALAGYQRACPKCGGLIQVPAGGAANPSQRLLVDASGVEMVEELSRRKRSDVLVVFETPGSESYELHKQSNANVRCYRTADMSDRQLMQALQGLGQMTQGKRTNKGGIGLGARVEPEPFELKGDRLGIHLDDFKAKYARQLGAGMSAPFCSDSFPGQALQALHAET